MPESQTIKYCYDLNDSIVDKVRKVAQNVYGAENVIFSYEKVKNAMFLTKSYYTLYGKWFCHSSFTLHFIESMLKLKTKIYNRNA